MRPRTLAPLLIAAALCATSSTATAAADDLAAIGNRCVIDQAGLLSAGQQRQILDLCRSLNQSGVAQLAVATVVNLGDRAMSDYATDLFKKWKLGHGKKRSDGLLVLVGPGRNNPWAMRVEVGYGLEGILPDGKVGRLLDESWVPARDRRAYGEGIVAVAQALVGVLAKDAAAGGDAAPTEESRRLGQQAGRGQPMNAGALGLAVLTMLGLLVVLGSSALRRTFPGKGIGILAAALVVITVVGLISMAGSTGGGWVALILGLIVNGLTYYSIRSHRCPKDGSWMLIEEEVVEQPTVFSEGSAEVWEHCTNKKCGYERTYEKILPRKEVRVYVGGGGGGGYGGGGGGGGGGDNDSFSGGGGESGGGGAERD